MKTLTKIEIIEETVEFYSKDPEGRRSLDEFRDCKYNGPKGTHCAVGRCMLSKYKRLGSKFKHNSEDVYVLLDADNIDHFLSPKYRGHGITFWQDLQELHDKDSFWDKRGLSAYGKTLVKELKEKYKN